MSHIALRIFFIHGPLFCRYHNLHMLLTFKLNQRFPVCYLLSWYESDDSSAVSVAL